MEHDRIADYLYILYALDKKENPMPAPLRTKLLMEVGNILKLIAKKENNEWIKQH